MDELTRLARTLPAQRRAVSDDDAVQEAFVAVAVAVAGTDIAVLGNAPGYWYRIAARRRIDNQRARTRAAMRTTSLTVEPRDPEVGDNIDDLIDELDAIDTPRVADELTRTIATVLPQLAPRRQALITAELAGITDTETLATMLGCTTGAIRVLRHRTYRQLRDLLDAA